MVSFSSAEADGRPTFSPTTPHFFKLIQDTSRDTKILNIPKKFVMQNGDDLSNPVFLELPSGSKWKVELRRWDDEVWFDKGWPELSEFYSLDFGHWLLFGYEGNSKFSVLIFDRSCTEIDYPLTMPRMEDNNEDDCSSDDSDENLHNAPPCQRKPREKSTPLRPRSRKRSICKSRDGGVGCSTRNVDAIVLQKANAYKSKKPSSFLVVMRPSYIANALLRLPSEVRKLRLDRTPEVILRVSNGKTWPVKMCYGERKFPLFSRGWKQVVHHNNLKVGDAVVFVLINNNLPPLFDVVIFRSREALKFCLSGEKIAPKMEVTDPEDGDFNYDSAPPCPHRHKKSRTSSRGKHDIPTEEGDGVRFRTQSGDAIALQRANAYKSDKPSSFLVVMRHSYINNFILKLPSEFRKHHLAKESCEVILRVSKGKTWPVYMKYDGERTSSFTNGWVKVVRGNNLKVGDVVVFMWINSSTEPLFDAVIFRSREAANEMKKEADHEDGNSNEDSTDDSDDDFNDDFGNDSSETEMKKETEQENGNSTDDSDEDFGDDSVEIYDKFLSCPIKTRGKSALPHRQPHKKNRSSSGKYDSPTTKGDAGTSSSRRFQKRIPEFHRRMDALNISRDTAAMTRAMDFKARNPSSFLVPMKPTYVGGRGSGWYLWLPSDFSEIYVSVDSCKATLQVSDGRSWPVDLKCSPRKGKASFTFQSGWKRFVLDDNLKVGDVCVFVRRDKVKPLFDVALFRTVEAANCAIGGEPNVSRMMEDDNDHEDDGSVQVLGDDFRAC